MAQQAPILGFKTNVLLLKVEGVERNSHDEVLTPNNMGLNKLRKTDQFKRDVIFHENMSDIAVGNRLKEVFPILRNKRFFCATSAIGNNARLDFDGERRVWNGATIKRKAKGNRCMYIVSEVEVAHTLDEVTMSIPQSTQNESPQGSGQQPQGAPVSVVLPQTVQSTSTHGGFQSLTQQYQLQPVATLRAGTQQHQHHHPLGSSPKEQSLVAASQPITSVVEVPTFFPSASDAQLQQSTPLPQLSQQMFSNTTVKTSESSQTESDYYSEEVFSEENLLQGNQASEQNTTPQEGRAEIYENRGPLEGRMPFELLLHDTQLPASVWFLTLIFGSKGVKVQKQMDGSWLGKTPPGESYGTVTVQIMDRNSEVARTEYTYVDKDQDAYETVVRNFEMQFDLFNTFHEIQSNAELPGNNNTAKRSITGEVEQEDEPHQVDVLRRMLYTAARTGVAQFAQMVFSTSAGRVVFETYKKTPPLPEDIAEANGHNDLAAYFHGITERFSNEDDTNQPRSNQINWLELLRAVQQREHPPGTSKPFMKELREEGSSESVYFGDVEASFSDSDRETSGPEDQLKRMVSGAGISIHHGHVSGKDEELLREDKTEVLPEFKIPGKSRIHGEGDESSVFLSELHETTSEGKGPGEWIQVSESDVAKEQQEREVVWESKFVDQEGEPAISHALPEQKRHTQACPIQLGLEQNYVMTELDIHHYQLPDVTGGEWKDLARALGFNEVAMESIEMEKGTSLREWYMLLALRWLCQEGRDAIAGKLANLEDKLIQSEERSNFEIKIQRIIEQLVSLQEEGSKMNAMIKELEKKNLKLQARNKELEDARQKENGDLDDTADVLRDTDQAARELRISERLENLNQMLSTYVTAPLEVPEVKQDQLKTPVKLDLLTRLSERLQELYSDVQAMVSETCKCSEDLKRDFYDFAYHGLRAEHNELVHRVKDLESTEPEMSEEEREDFEKLQKYQVNRERHVERLDKLWRGLFSPPERLPKTPWSDTSGIRDNSKKSKKDLEDTADVLRDTDQAARELRISERLENLNQMLSTYVTAPLEVPEVKQDQLKTPVKLDLLTRLSERLQELYSDVQAMVSETCKCSEDLKRDFYDFAYYGLRAEHNELVHRVKDLESTEPEMSEEEREDFEKLQKYQVNRERHVERLDKLWRGLFSPPERLPKTPWSDTSGIRDNSKKSKKVSKHTDPGARPKQTKPRVHAPSVNCKDDKNEFSLNVTKRKTVKRIFRRKEKD